MFTPLSTELEQSDAYDSLRTLCQKRFDGGYNANLYTFFQGSRKHPELDNFGIRLINGKKFRALSLDRRRSNSDRYRMVLKFSTFSKATGTALVAAILAKDARGRVALLHNGNVSPAYSRPGFGDQVQVGERSYFFVSFLTDPNFFANLVKFHRSRKADLAQHAVKVRLRRGIDLGPSTGGCRPQVYYEARHHPIAQALLSYLTERGFKEMPVKFVAPDLLMHKDENKILIEVKPSNEARDLMIGCAQLLIYDKFAMAERRCLVAGRPKDSPFSSAISEFMAENEIDFVEYTTENENVLFHSLDRLLQ